MMDGQYGLHHIEFYKRRPHTRPLKVVSYGLLIVDGLCNVRLEVATGSYDSWLMYAGAICTYSEGDDATFEAAKQWLLDIVNARYA